MILTVCTGNTCRSPMAEGLLRHRISESLDCPFDQLDQHGIMVMSAGISAPAGSPASREAEAVLAERQLDISSHISRQVDEQLIRFADQIWTMTRVHRDVIVQQWPHVADRVHVLDPAGRDVADPIGGPLQQYHECAKQIDSFLEQRLDKIDLASFRPAESDRGETA
jgi:protein-tyrosine phosphatase